MGLSDDEFWDLTPGLYLALIERQRLAQERAFFPFACLLAQHRNLAFGIKHDRQYSPEEFMPKRHTKSVKAARGGGLGPEVFARFAEGATDG